MITYQVQIVLKKVTPKIWRRLLIPSDMLLSDFHKIIQTSMGWTNSHLHQFIRDETFYTHRIEEDDFWEEMRNVDYKDMRISDLLENEKEKIVYEYDFGDGWEHDIILEKIITDDSPVTGPTCIAGKMNCPPEDCGGPWAYPDLLTILKNPKHKKYQGIVEWIGEPFDPEYFNKDEVNKLLKKRNFGCG
ncbi:MAG: plasmid pRiA4b ORF-3 family protein [bacterium]